MKAIFRRKPPVVVIEGDDNVAVVLRLLRLRSHAQHESVRREIEAEERRGWNCFHSANRISAVYHGSVSVDNIRQIRRRMKIKNVKPDV